MIDDLIESRFNDELVTSSTTSGSSAFDNKVSGSTTWGQRVIEEWNRAGVLGSYGDMRTPSPELARELRMSLEATFTQELGGGS